MYVCFNLNTVQKESEPEQTGEPSS